MRDAAPHNPYPPDKLCSYPSKVSDIFGYDVVVHPRVCRVHGIDEEDVIAAWNNALPLGRRVLAA